MIEFYNRDCLQALKEYPDKAFDLAIVDPPYSTPFNNGGVTGIGLASGSTNTANPIKRGGGTVKTNIITATPKSSTRSLGTLHRLKSISSNFLGLRIKLLFGVVIISSYRLAVALSFGRR